MKELKFTENGPVFVEKLEISTSKEFPSQSEEGLFKAYKDTILYALNKRLNHCMSDLEENSSGILTYNASSIIYTRKDGTVNQFNLPSYKAIEKAVCLVKNDQIHDFTANQWEQLVKALYWISPKNIEGYSFSQLISYCIENLCNEVSNLITRG